VLLFGCASGAGSSSMPVASAAVSQAVRNNNTPRPMKRSKTLSFFNPEPGTGFWYYQQQAEWFYNYKWTQYTIAVLIFANFFANCIQKQMDPFDRVYPDEFAIIEDAFNIIFTLELAINMYAHWCWPFWSSGWNQFDVLVVAVGILSLARATLPGPLSMLRMLRAFRVFRLFKRIKSLQKIIVSLFKAVPGMLNAGFIMVLVMCIYAILAVEYFGDFGDMYDNATDSYYYLNMDNETTSAMTARNLAYGEEYFGTFARSIFTLFQVLTGESWAEAVARPVMFGQREVAASLFFVSFVIINSFILINVVVAVLLEKCLDSSDDEKLEAEAAEAVGEEPPEQPDHGKHMATAAEVVELRASLAMVLEALKKMQVDVQLLKEGA